MLDALQGAWRIGALEINGQAMPAAMLAGAEIRVDGDRFTSLGMGATYSGTVSVAAGEPHDLFTLSFAEGPEAGRANHGIHRLEGDTWVICLNMAGGPAPATFATAPGDGCALQTLVRAAPAAGAVTSPPVGPRT